MFPKTHFLSSALVTGLVAIWQGVSTRVLFEWMFIGSVIGVAIDFDHILYPLFRRDRRYLFWNTLRNPLSTIKDLRKFVDDLVFPGISKIHLTSHGIFAVIIILIFRTILPSLILPVAISLSTHILADIIDTSMHPERW